MSRIGKSMGTERLVVAQSWGKGHGGGVTANRSGVPFETAENVLKLDSGNGV